MIISHPCICVFYTSPSHFAFFLCHLLNKAMCQAVCIPSEPYGPQELIKPITAIITTVIG